MIFLYENNLTKTPEGENKHELTLTMFLLIMLPSENYLENCNEIIDIT